MSFQRAMFEFIDKLKAEYGLNLMIKSIEVSEELHQRIEWEIIKKTLKPDSDVQSKVHGLKFFGPTEVIEIKKHEANN